MSTETPHYTPAQGRDSDPKSDALYTDDEHAPIDHAAEDARSRKLAARYELEFVDLAQFHINNDLFRSIPADLMLRYGFVPYRRDGQTLLIVVSDPSDLQAIDEIGLQLGTLVRVTVDGYSEFGTGFMPELDPENYSDAVEYKIITPIEIGAGFSVNFQGLILSAQSTIIDYSQVEFNNTEGLSERYVEMLNKDIKDELRSVFNYNVGIEYNIPTTGLRIRGGYFVQPSPYQGDPSEFNRKYATAGIGFLADETVGIDLAYAYGWWQDIGDNYGSDISRTFQDITTSKFMITGIYRF
jgi:hypothetical protein